MDKIRLKNKKGSVIPDTIYVMVLLLAVAMSLVIAYHLISKIQPQIEEVANTTIGATAMQDTKEAIANYDYFFIFIMVGAFLGIIISAFFIPSHPVLAIPSMFFLMFVAMVGAVLSNVYEKFTEAPQLAESASVFDIMFTLMSKLPTYVWVLGLFAIVVMVAKWSYREV